jgi:low affinity Fe/Cu permease
MTDKNAKNGQNGPNGKNWAERIGCLVSEVVSDIAAHPLAQFGFVIFCIVWFVAGLPVDILTAALSILAITLTQMVLNRQNEREVDDHRRDVAMHAKLDELIAVSRRARNDFVGVEEKEEDEIVQLKEEVKEALEDAQEEPRPVGEDHLSGPSGRQPKPTGRR